MWQPLITVAVLLGASLPTFNENVWQQAPPENAPVKRLPPSAFSQLPRSVVRHLQARGCMIPQSWVNRRPHNVISGAFARKGQRDWAVLCYQNGFSSVLVFWNGRAHSVAELARRNDDSKTGYLRAISAAGKDYIMSHYQAYKESGAPKPPTISHQGINDIYVEKASTVYYYYRGKWRRLQGAD